MCEGIAEGSVGVPWSCFVGAARNGVDLVMLREAVVVRLREAVVVRRIGWTTSSRSSVDRCGVSPRQCPVASVLLLSDHLIGPPPRGRASIAAVCLLASAPPRASQH